MGAGRHTLRMMSCSDSTADDLASLLSAAHSLWDRGGGGDLPIVREAHALHLVVLHLSEAIGKLSGAVVSTGPTSPGVGGALPTRVEEDDYGDSVAFDESAGLQPAPGDIGFRRLRAGFASEAECAQLRAAALASMASAFRRGGQTTLSVVSELPERFAAAGTPWSYAILHSLLERVRMAAAEDDAAAAAAAAAAGTPCPVCGTRRKRATAAASAGSLDVEEAPELTAAPATAEDSTEDSAQPLHHRGALLVRLLPPDEAEATAPACWALPARQDYWEPHVDQHNAADYDVSAVLYLTSQDVDFRGGSFAFHDADHDVAVAPRQGHLLTFSSGAENPHSAGRVTAGCRFALAMWFTRDARHAVELPPLLPAEALSVAAPLPLWSSDRAIASAASCCLASNDPLQEALLEASARGQPLSRVLAAQASFATPAAWRARMEASQETEPAPRQEAVTRAVAASLQALSEVEVDADADADADFDADAHEAVAERRQLEALRAAVRGRLRARRQLLETRAASEARQRQQQLGAVDAGAQAPPEDDGFDVFG